MCRINVKAAGEEYIARLAARNYSPATMHDYEYNIQRFALDFPGDAVITAGAVEEWQKKQSERVSANTLNHRMIVLEAFFAWYAEKENEVNPFRAVKKPRVEELKYNLLTLEEINKLLTEERTGGQRAKNVMYKAIVTLLATSGLRSGELRELKKGDVDFENAVINVRHGKGDKARLAPFPTVAQEAVKKWIESAPRKIKEGDLLFGSDCDEKGHKKKGVWKKMSSAGLNDGIKKYVESITGREIHTHLLRHAAASLWDDLGLSPRTIQKCMGHARFQTTEKVYISVLDKSKAAQTATAAFANWGK